MNSKTVLRYEPLLKCLYFFGTCTVFSVFSVLNGDPPGPLLFLLIIDIVLLLFHLILRTNVIAILSEEGINLSNIRVIKWEEIVSWTYSPGGKLPLQNSLLIETNIGNKFLIKGFSFLKLARWLKSYVSQKGEGFFGFLISYL